MPKLRTIFQTGNAEQGWSGKLQISDDDALYWNDKPVQMKQQIRFGWVVNTAAVLAALATVAQAVVAVLDFYFNW